MVPKHRIVLAHQGKLYVSWTGQVYDSEPVENLIKLILTEDPFYIAGINLYLLIAEVTRECKDNIPGWRTRFTLRKRHGYLKEDGEKHVSGQNYADYISISRRFKLGSKRNRREESRTKRFEIMNLEMFKTPAPDSVIEQMDMAIALLDMCDSRGVQFKSTRGSLGTAMLKASPNWEKGRRSALPFINREARKHAPGNYYSTSHRIKKIRLKGETHKLNPTMDHCYLVDQTSAHHNIVTQIPLPHPEDIRARGNWKQALAGKPTPWCNPYSRVGNLIMSGELVGLFLVGMRTSHVGPSVKHLQLPYAQEYGYYLRWIYTPDLRIIKNSFQLLIEMIYCGMVGVKSDEALKEYSQWALDEMNRDKDKAVYKKSALLAALGMLAFNTVDKPIYRCWANGQEPKNPVYLPRVGLVNEHKIELPNDVEPSIVNVINRGLIESETRARSIEYARELHALGYHVPQIYADAILVETNSLPFIKKGWRISHSLEDVWIPRDNAFLSSTICKLPGFQRGDVDSQIWRERYEEAIRPVTMMK